MGSGKENSGEDDAEEDATVEDEPGSGDGMSSFFLTNLL